jgi:GNAT superfamily N-acetyltransferase
MSNEATIGAAEPCDVPELAVLMQQYWAFEGIAGFDAERASSLLSQFLSQPHFGIIGTCRAGGELVGYLIAVFVFSFEYQGLVAEIDEFFVRPQARSRGMGTALLEFAESGLRERGCTWVQLQLGAANAAAHAFYRRHGYAERADYELLNKKLAGTRPAKLTGLRFL